MKRMSRILGLVLTASFIAFAGIPQLAAHAVDTTPPTGTIVINNNRSATNSPSVTLALTWSDGLVGSGVTRMRFSNDGATWSAWEPLAAARAYTLPAGADGHRTVRVQYLDRANNRSVAYSDYILLDTASPTGSIIINGGAATTVSLSVSLGLIWSDGLGAGVSKMRFSDDGSTWTAWESPTSTRGHTLPLAVLKNQTVRVQYLDGANNYSAVYSDYIKLVATPAAGSTETVLLPGSVPLVMVRMPGGTFMMGRNPDEAASYPNEEPRHAVTLGGFWMAKYELTKRQWLAVMKTAPWAGIPLVLDDLDSPAVYVSWDDAQSFLTALNGYTGKTFRLPSESQWEYACRAGTATRFYWGDDDADYSLLGNYAWWDINAWYAGQQYAHVVGQKLPNTFGLFDMSGNVYEWCEDDEHYFYDGAPTGGQAWVDSPRSQNRVIRGGSWYYSGNFCRSAARNGTPPSGSGYMFGFRVSKS